MRTTTYAEDRLAELHHDGGFTVSPQYGDRPIVGWTVALSGHETTIPLSDITAADIAHHMLDLPPRTYQGGWVEDGQVYLDAVIILTDRDAAIEVGRIEHQLAIYNLETGETVKLDALATV